MAIATADEKAVQHASMTTLRGGRSHTLRKGRHLKKKENTETSQSSDDPQEGRNINAGGMKKKKKAKSKGKAKQDIKKTITQATGAFSQISSQLKEFESKNVLGQGPLDLGEAKQEGAFVPETLTTWTPPSSIIQEEEAKEDMPNDAETSGNMPEEGMPEKEDMPDVSMPEKEAGSGMPEKDMEGAPEVSKPEMETETMPEKDESDNSIGSVATTPVVEEKPEVGVPAETSPPEPVAEISPPETTTTTPATPTTPTTTATTTGTTGTSSGNALAQRPVAVGANCDLNVPSLEAKENPATTTKRCKASCECDEGCCIAWTFGSFCAAPHPSREGRAAFGGGYVKCMPLVEPSQ